MSTQINVRKSDGSSEPYSERKLINIVQKVCKRTGQECSYEFAKDLVGKLYIYDGILCSSIRRQLEHLFAEIDKDMLVEYRSWKNKKDARDAFVEKKKEFIDKYKKSSNTANATIDDNSNVANKNVAILNSEIHKTDNIQISRAMIMDKLKSLHPEFNSKQYVRDLEDHIIYKHDESSFAGAIAPYCVSITLYPFLTNGIKDLGGLSAAPKNIDSYCGMLCNLLFAISSQFAGAVAVSEALLYFTYFAKKEWGEDFWRRPDEVIGKSISKEKTIRSQIHQYWQQIVYTTMQPVSSRGYQSIFLNFSYFDRPFFEGMFGEFMFPDGTKPDYDSLCWIQKEFMMWFNTERLKCVLTFPVETVTLLYKDGKFADEDMFNFVCDEYARGHSFFTYISDTVDSLSSCCFKGDEVIQLHDKNGDKFYTSIKDFVDSQNSEINKHGEKLIDKYYIDSHNIVNDITESVQITGILKKKYTGKMYKIYTNENNYITVTSDHILKCIDKQGNYVEVKAEDLQNYPDYQLVVEN